MSMLYGYLESAIRRAVHIAVVETLRDLKEKEGLPPYDEMVSILTQVMNEINGKGIGWHVKHYLPDDYPKRGAKPSPRDKEPR